MDLNTKNFRQVESIQCSDTITSIDASIQSIAVGCLDDTFYIWQRDTAALSKDPKFRTSGNAMGVIDLAFNKKSTHLAVSCMDSTVKILEMNSSNLSVIECNVMENWKIEFVGDHVVTCGDLGRINFHDLESKERVRKIEAGDIFLTALAQSYQQGHFIAAGNNNGDLFITNISSNKNKTVSLKPHYKLIREIAFLEDDSKLLTASDDGSIKIVDISSEKVISTLEGHKLAVSSIDAYQLDAKVVFSSSFDKTVRSWDMRAKSCIGVTTTSSPIWDIKSVGKHLLAGGENGALTVYSIE